LTLTKFSDYSLRLLIYLGLHDDRLVSVAEISRAYQVSPHILVKVVQLLTEQELIVSVRGTNQHGTLVLKGQGRVMVLESRTTARSAEFTTSTLRT